ncbi:MAG: DUF3794 domain-containing protein [Clostridia bacterium]|nr:DUF3794 domain-containing protein [Clostridia bacterium]
MENDSLKTTYVKNLNKQTFSTIITVPIDSNVNIKNIINTESYLFDAKVECASGKAIVNGKIGIKVLYMDTDGILNSINETQNFTETFVDTSITADCFINLCQCNIVSTVISTVGALKVNCEISCDAVLYVNLPLPNGANNYENMIVKKSTFQTTCISSTVDTSFEYTVNFETKNAISKILSYCSQFVLDSVTANEDCALVEGKLFSKLLYETTKEEETEINELCEANTIKTEIPIAGLTKDDVLDLCFNLDYNQENISTEIMEEETEITITHKVVATGVVLKPISIDVVDDMYSVDNEISLAYTERTFNKTATCFHSEDSISGEIALNDDEPIIDEICSNTSPKVEVTNSYIKDDALVVEGVVSSTLVYVDENKEIKSKTCELPFVINTKQGMEQNATYHVTARLVDTKFKVKRGTVVELEYSIKILVCAHNQSSVQMIDSFTLGKATDYSNYDYQIFVAKQGETRWDLCKRIKISPDALEETNKDLPLVLQGGEKVIIKR